MGGIFSSHEPEHSLRGQGVMGNAKTLCQLEKADPQEMERNGIKYGFTDLVGPASRQKISRELSRKVGRSNKETRHREQEVDETEECDIWH